jgi:sterol desaturase/sphingolipid hydroxylase (fatty acid hydroxylase superfamily)
MHTLILEVARSATWFGLLTLIFVPLERLFAERPQRILRRQLAVDLGYYALNSLLTVTILASAAGVVAIVARHLLLPSFIATMVGLPLWGRVAATLVVGELGSYWGHRWTHEVPFLWRFHAVHHSAEEVDWLTGSRGHPVDLIFVHLCGLVMISAFGLAGPGAGGGLPLLLATVVSIIWGYFIHANVRWRFGWAESVIATPAFHRWHHSNGEMRDRNYASTLPLYDRLFGTFYLPKDDMPETYGIDAEMPAGLVSQLAAPLMPRAGIPASRFSADRA